MSAHGEPEIGVSAVRADPQTRLRKWANRRSRQLLWVLLAVSSVIILILASAMFWRSICLFNLPDVGDLFSARTC